MRTVAVVVLLALLPRLAWADPPAPAPPAPSTVAPLVPVPPGDDVVVVAKKGDPVPFTGQLFDQSTALRWANYLQQCRFRLQADVDYQKKYDQADTDYQKRLLAIEQQKYDAVSKDLQDKLDKANAELASPPFYKTVAFGVVVGALAMGVAVGLAAAGLNAVK